MLIEEHIEDFGVYREHGLISVGSGSLPTLGTLVRYCGTGIAQNRVTMVGFFPELLETNLPIRSIMQIEGKSGDVAY